VGWTQVVNEISPSQRLTLLLDQSPLKGIQRWLWVLSTGGTLLDGFVLFALGVAMPLIIPVFHVTPDIVGLIGSALVMGAVLGAGIGGRLADHLGRKRLMVADMMIIAIGAATSALANGPAMLFVGQFIVGIGVGIDFPVSSSYISEISPKRARDRMMVATIACQSIGMLLAAAITLILLSRGSAQSWRLFLWSEGLIALLFFVLRFSAPDSPHWLMSRGRFTEAAQAFIRIIPEQRETVLQITGDHEKLGASIPQLKAGMATLFSPRYRARTALVTIPWFLMDIATYGVGLFTPVIFRIDRNLRKNARSRRTRPRSRRRQRHYRLVFAVWFSAWNLERSSVRAHPNAVHRFRRHGCRHVDVNGGCGPNELRFAHSTCVHRVHRV